MDIQEATLSENIPTEMPDETVQIEEQKELTAEEMKSLWEQAHSTAAEILRKAGLQV